MIGHVSVEQYIFDDSKSIVDGMFCGLALDEDNESEKTGKRLQSWARLIMQEAII